MYNVHANYHSLIKTEGATRRVRLYKIPDSVNCTSDSQVTANGTLLKSAASDTNSNGLLSTVTLEDLFNKETDLTIGGSVSCLLTLSLIDDSAASMLTAGRYKAYLDVLDGSTWRNCPLGVFLLEEPEKNGSFVRVSGFDQMQYFDRTVDRDWWESIFTQGTLKVQRTLNQIYSELVTQVSAEVGVTITPANTDMLNKTVTYTAPFDPIEMTYRDILNWIAEASGTVARFNRNGVLQLKYFTALDSAYSIDADALGNGVFNIVLSEYSVAPIDKLQVRASDSDYGTILGTGENAYVITDNGFLSGTSDAQVRTRATPIYNRLIAFGSYTPISTSLIADPSIEAGDVITFTRGGVAYTLPIFQQTLTWRGGFVRGDIISTGSPKRPTLSAVNRYEFRTRQTVHKLEVTAEALRSDITTVSDNLATNYPTTETMNSAIQQSAAAIDLSVSQRFDALSIGGTNFLLNSAFTDATTGLDKWNNNGNADIYTRQADGIVCGRMRVYQKGVSGSASVSQTFYPRVKDDPAGTTYTVSGDFSVSNYSAGTDSPSLVFIINGYYDDGGASVYTTGTLVKGSRDLSDCGFDWERREFTVRFDQRLTNAVFLVFARDCNCNLYWKNLKIEHGNTATAWSPAPEDYATTGEAAALQAQITVNATNIESKVSQTDYNGNQIASLINQSATTVDINAEHINLNGAVTANNNFKVNTDGTIEAKGATIDGTVESNGEDSAVSPAVTLTAKLVDGAIEIYRGSELVGRLGYQSSTYDGTYNTFLKLLSSDGSYSQMSPSSLSVHAKKSNGDILRLFVLGNDPTTLASLIKTTTNVSTILADIREDLFRVLIPTQFKDTTVTGSLTAQSSIHTSNGDLSKTGTRQVVNGSATTVATGSTYITLTSITLPAGKWIVYASAQFGGTSATGLRVLIISTAENSSTRVAEWAHDRRAGISGSNVYANCMHIADLTAETTLYLNVIQTSGASITAYGRVVAMRIA